jgi:hypothetical protein
LYRLTSVGSSASRKIICGSQEEASSPPTKPEILFAISSPKYLLPRMSTTTTTPAGPSFSADARASTFGIIAGGRLSMQ